MPDPRPPVSYWKLIEQVIPEEQREQLGELFLERLKEGWGGIELEFCDHRLKTLRVVRSIPAKKPDTSHLTC